MERRDREATEVFCGGGSADDGTGGGDDDRDPKPPTAGALKFPGFLTLTDEQLIGVIAEPFVMPGETEEEHLAEATAELLRRPRGRAGPPAAPRPCGPRGLAVVA